MTQGSLADSATLGGWMESRWDSFLRAFDELDFLGGEGLEGIHRLTDLPPQRTHVCPGVINPAT